MAQTYEVALEALRAAVETVPAIKYCHRGGDVNRWTAPADVDVYALIVEADDTPVGELINGIQEVETTPTIMVYVLNKTATEIEAIHLALFRAIMTNDTLAAAVQQIQKRPRKMLDYVPELRGFNLQVAMRLEISLYE